MNIALFAYSRQGCRTARKVLSCFPAATFKTYAPERFNEVGFAPMGHPSEPFYGELFRWADALIFVSSCGIAVREIAPHVQTKQTDPAVICMDELGHFVIPLLSGHIGGANELAQTLAGKLHAAPIITTATDLNHRFSVDSWASRNGYWIDDLHCAKLVSAAILERDIPLSCDFPITTPLPNGIVIGDHGDLGIKLSYRKSAPFRQTLNLIPRILHIGIGCRKRAPSSIIRDAVNMVLMEHGIDSRAIKCVASIDLKSNEPGLLEFCKTLNVSPAFYSARQLLEVPGTFTHSEFVQSVTGVDNVCERAALMGADQLIVKKTVLHGVTVAVAAETLEVQFG